MNRPEKPAECFVKGRPVYALHPLWLEELSFVLVVGDLLLLFNGGYSNSLIWHCKRNPYVWLR